MTGSELTDANIRQMVLDRIASGEAKNYTTIYGGHQFGSLADHPRIAVPITSGPNKGKTSSAAGRYQFLASTWDEQRRRLGLTDFSPASQDAAAWDLAQRVYRAQTGHSIVADARAGSVNWGSLGGTWESLLGKGSGPAVPGKAAGPAGTLPVEGTGSVPQPAPVDRFAQLTEVRSMLDSLMAKPPQGQAAAAASKPTALPYDPWRYAQPLGMSGGLNG